MASNSLTAAVGLATTISETRWIMDDDNAPDGTPDKVNHIASNAQAVRELVEWEGCFVMSLSSKRLTWNWLEGKAGYFWCEQQTVTPLVE